MELSFYSEPRGVFEEKLKGFSNTVIVRVGWSVSPGAVFIAQCNRWLFRSLLTVWSGEMNGSYLRWYNNPRWNPSWIGKAQDATKKTCDKGRALSPQCFIWWGAIIFKITLRFWFKDAENPVCRWMATNNSSDTVFLWGYIMLCCTGSKTLYWSLTARSKCFILQFKMLWNRQKQACLIN